MRFGLFLAALASAASIPAASAETPESALTARVTAAMRILVDPASVPSPSASGVGTAELRRAPDGLFYVDAVVNGAVVHFLVDTGSTSIVLTPDDARRAGIDGRAVVASSVAQTANGTTAFTPVTLSELDVGPLSNRAVPAVVASERLAVSLLGQSWLQQLSSVTIEGDRMVLR
jgi:aspartyl protease family protein